jgi:cobaltochelatase CobS
MSNQDALKRAKASALRAGLEPSEILRRVKNDPQAFIAQYDTEPAPQAEPTKPQTEPAPAPQTYPAGSIESIILAMIERHAPQTAPSGTVLLRPSRPPVTLPQLAHPALQRVLDAHHLQEPVYLVGPAGSGKTTLAVQLAQTLGLQCYIHGAVSQAHELFGWSDANGIYHGTAFRRAFEHGGICLIDEMDGSAPEALLALNAALANRRATFPDSPDELAAHPDFFPIAAANTLGHGATHQYVGRSPMDGATMDRFLLIEVNYDPAIEQAMGDAKAVAMVDKIRALVAAKGWPLIVSPRATRRLSGLLSLGYGERDALQMAVLGTFSTDQREAVYAAL